MDSFPDLGIPDMMQGQQAKCPKLILKKLIKH